jgi:ABC-2 type transport system permease protein
MSVRNTLRAMPTLARVAFAEAMAYRAELLVWVLSTTMPLVMLALWSAVARDQPIGRFGQAQFVAYFLAAFIVRQLTGSWASWEINYEIRQGTLAMRLLRPVHPLFCHAINNIAALPMRLIVSLPVAVVALLAVGWGEVTHSPALFALFLVSIVGGWLITLFANFAVGCLAFFLESSIKVMDIWLALYFVMSGYLLPIELFPPFARALADVLPFRYQLGLPIEILTRAYDADPLSAARLVLWQWCWVLVMLTLTTVLWRRGLARFSAYGG